jgi:hypothetical protein
MKAKWTILAAIGFLFLLLSLPFVPEYLLAGSHQKAVEASFKKFAESDKDGIYSAFDSMLINRVAADPSVAKRVKMSNISDCDFLGSDFSALEHLPNLEELVIYSSKNCDAVVPVINRLPRLTRITFADCGLSDAGFDKLNHRGLMSFRMSAYAKNWTDDAITRLKERMTTCSFDIDAQE